MYYKKKGHSKKLYLTIALLVILIVATAAIIYSTQTPPVKEVVAGVSVGDSFTYGITGASSLGLDASEPEGFSNYNATDYYKITIADVNGSSVTMDTLWRFTNGTEIQDSQTIDLSNGETDQDGFWAVYASNLNVNDLLRPAGFDGVKVNKTDTKTYADSTRERNYFAMEGEFFDVRDPTRSTLFLDYRDIYFDKQTGMLENFVNYQSYNNPQMVLVITWKLIDSSVWAV